MNIRDISKGPGFFVGGLYTVPDMKFLLNNNPYLKSVVGFVGNCWPIKVTKVSPYGNVQEIQLNSGATLSNKRSLINKESIDFFRRVREIKPEQINDTVLKLNVTQDTAEEAIRAIKAVFHV